MKTREHASLEATEHLQRPEQEEPMTKIDRYSSPTAGRASLTFGNAR